MLQDEMTSPGPAAGAGAGPAKVWATKGIAFWGVLSAILLKTQPESLLEIGSGRSTTFLGDYAFRFKKRFVSIEQDVEWHRKVANDLRHMGVRDGYVHHVPLVAAEPFDWYDRERFAAATGDRPFDLVFLDGPQGNARRSPDGRRAVRRCCRAARMLIVDDVHRGYNLDIFRDLSQQRFPGSAPIFHAYGNNVIGLAAIPAWRDTAVACFDFLDQRWSADPPEVAVPKRKQEAESADEH